MDLGIQRQYSAQQKRKYGAYQKSAGHGRCKARVMIWEAGLCNNIHGKTGKLEEKVDICIAHWICYRSKI